MKKIKILFCILAVALAAVVTAAASYTVTSVIYNRIESSREDSTQEDNEEEDDTEKIIYDDDKYIGFDYGGGGFGDWLSTRSADIIIYNDGRADLIFEGEVVYETTIDIDALKSEINRDKIGRIKIREDTAVCDGSSSSIYLYLKDGKTKYVGGYMVKNKSYNRYRAKLIAAFKEGELDEALENAKKEYAKEHDISIWGD